MAKYLYDQEVQDRLGKNNYEQLMNAVRTNKINQCNMYDFARALGPVIGGNHGTRVAHGGICDFYEVRQILSDWYSEEMHGLTQEQALGALNKVFQKDLYLTH